jgi:hypothetical protein
MIKQFKFKRNKPKTQITETLNYMGIIMANLKQKKKEKIKSKTKKN